MPCAHGSKAPDRLLRAVEQCDVEPDDRLLELGCGHGVAADLVCRRLTSGPLAAIDRSQKMIDAALRRNAPHVIAGRTTFLCTTLEDADLGEARFDKVLGVHFPPLRRDPAETMALVERLLAAGGTARFF